LSGPTGYSVRARNLAPDSDNKIHDDAVARQFGFNGALVPGVDVFAYASHPFVEAWGLEFLQCGRMQARFRHPVYDGETIGVRVSADGGLGGLTVAVEGEADDERGPRAIGEAWPKASTDLDLSGFTSTPLPLERRPTGPDPIPLGPLGSIEEPVELARHEAYLEGINEELDIYRSERVAHPGALLRLVNDLLVRNVALGPWIHTSSDATFLAAARLPATLTADGIVRDEYERNGHRYVRYDALVRCEGEPVIVVDHTAIYRLAE
jgi:acyl dehydratase